MELREVSHVLKGWVLNALLFNQQSGPGYISFEAASGVERRILETNNILQRCSRILQRSSEMRLAVKSLLLLGVACAFFTLTKGEEAVADSLLAGESPSAILRFVIKF